MRPTQTIAPKEPDKRLGSEIKPMRRVDTTPGKLWDRFLGFPMLYMLWNIDERALPTLVQFQYNFALTRWITPQIGSLQKGETMTYMEP